MKRKLPDHLRLEKDLHRDISNDLLRRGIFTIHSRNDRKSTVAAGTPDYIFCLPGPIPIAIECKRPGEKPSKEQLEVGEQMQRNGWMYYVVYSIQEYYQIINLWLH